MARMEKYVTAAAVLAVLTGTYWVSYAVAQGRAAYGIEVYSVEEPSMEPKADEADEAGELGQVDEVGELGELGEIGRPGEIGRLGEIGQATRRPAR